ncbi:MAG: glycoside hydrolase family 2 [Chloroflexia bacterium]|nr:glycoside hydrolase family 2 [Chloroflexia bacterium]
MPRQDAHPRPQLTRNRWIDLSGPWGFAHDDGDIGLDEDWVERTEVFDQTIEVPFPPESAASGIADPAPHPVVWYRRAVQLDPADRAAGRRLLLHFGAVDYSADVWVNGRRVAHHEGGHTPFSADITPELHPVNAEQVIVVRAEDQPGDLGQPRGKQDWQTPSHGIWYKRTTGIWQPVWLESVLAAHVASLRWIPDVDRGTLGLHATLNKAAERPLNLRVRLSLRNTVLSDDTYSVERGEVRREIALASGGINQMRDQLLWSPENPNLIEAALTLLDGETTVDEVGSYAGLRSVGFENGRFLLNGRAFYLRLALEQGYWPESHLAAPSDDALRREVELAKELGFNGVRIHQKVEDPRFLTWCDRLGLLVWGEMANAYTFSTRAVERLIGEWIEVVRRDASHPCIVTWVPLNESWGVPALSGNADQQHYLQALYHLTRALDPTRPVITNDGWEHVQSDIWSVHDYSFDGETLTARYGTPEALEHTLRNVHPGQHAIFVNEVERRGEPVMITEYGGLSYAPAAGERWFGYGTVRTAEEYEAKYAELTGAILDCGPVAGFCYTQLTDTEQETNGLLTENREPKLDPARIHAITSRPARSVPREQTAAHRKRAQSGEASGA